MSKEFTLFQRGTISRVSGKPGSGKTDGSLYLAELQWKRARITVLTNIVIDWEKNPDHPMRSHIHQVTSLKGLLWKILDIREGILILDEAGIFGSTGAAGRRQDLGTWEMILKLIRKFGLAVMWIDQRGKGSTPPTVRELSSWHIHRPSKFIMEIYEVFYKDDHRDPIERIRARWRMNEKNTTTVPYDTHAPGSFDMNLGDRDVYDPEKDKWHKEEIRLREILDAIRNVREKDLRPTMKRFLEKNNMAPEPETAAAEEREREKEEEKGLPTPSSPAMIPVLPQRALTRKEIVFWILDLHEKAGKDPPKTKVLAHVLMVPGETISRIKNQWKFDNPSKQ